MALAPLEHRFVGPPRAPVVLLLPAAGTRWSMWEPQLPELTRHLRVLRVNLRGPDGEPPGATVDAMADAVLDLLKVRRLERVSIVGAALGAAVALTAARKSPRSVERLGLLSASARTRDPSAWRRRAILALGSGMPAVVPDATRSWFTPRFAQERPDVCALLARELVAMSTHEFAAVATAFADADLRPALRDIPHPTLVISSAHDPEAPPRQGRHLAERLPRCRYAVVSGGAHLVSIERSDRVSGLLLDHLVGSVSPQMDG
ncbi:alpha/beta fold hydrolase [Spiractinospora alimapuensis]|uniref:alpha/beta fold hydrolase n=1 Tax=Spiractinospora alimapuensis TaxID=2820884 RepID=UPI001F170B92|nr:alpha/beta hydrolase [Spiractinospora alimapuensis]QVQ50316.1 alpha/beta fold hydrolase [Spiractinospora alimapuensis]